MSESKKLRKLVPKLPIEELRAAIDYDPLTGLLTWKISPNTKIPAGKRAGSNRRGRWQVGFRGRIYRAGPLIWALVTGEWPNGMVEHKNRKPLDDRWANLRLADAVQNGANRSRTKGRALPKGVTPQNGRFRARLYVRRKLIWLGSFATPTEAAEAYLAEAKRQSGEFATDGDSA